MQNMRLKRVVIKTIIKIEIRAVNRPPTADVEEIKRKCQSINFSELLDYIGNEFCAPATREKSPLPSTAGHKRHHRNHLDAWL